MAKKSDQIYVRFTSEEKAKIKEMAEKEYRSMSEYCRIATLEKLKRDAGK